MKLQQKGDFNMNAEGVVEHVVSWLKDYANNAGCRGFVIGISGGIDSAVTSTLAAKSGLPLLCVEMPIHQHVTQVSRAQKHITWLEQNFSNVNREEVQLTSVFDGLIRELPAVENEEDRFMSLANTRARLRMTTLYYFAALKGYLVVGTGNKIEDFGVGFYTKYGDGGVDLSPIADLVKSEVFELGAYLNVNQDIIDAPPADGLWADDRTDEDQIGASYPELEWAMDYDKSDKKESLTTRQEEVLAIYQRLNRMNLHKMKPIPVCEISDELKNR